jgi:hypothetical protein
MNLKTTQTVSMGARMKPQAFAADAVAAWIFNRSLLILIL